MAEKIKIMDVQSVHVQLECLAVTLYNSIYGIGEECKGWLSLSPEQRDEYREATLLMIGESVIWMRERVKALDD